MRNKLLLFLATGFGSGFSPYAPGTVGTLVAIPVYLALAQAAWSVYAVVLTFLTGAACYISQQAERILDRKDAPSIVIDEIVGYLFTLFLLPVTLTHVLLGFALFRFFDIVKVFPAGYVQDNLPGGYGVVADDVVAGIYANLVLQILFRMWGV